MTSSHPRVLVLNATLKHSPEESSTHALAEQLSQLFSEASCDVTVVRPVDHTLPPGISADLGAGDDWPRMRQQILDADIVVFATPTWLGSMTSVMRRVLERLNADITTRAPDGSPLFANTVATALVVGNEDGAHRIVADLLQATNDLGFSNPANGSTYWNGRAMEHVNYIDLDSTPKPVAAANRSLVANAIHLAQLLRATPYPVTE